MISEAKTIGDTFCTLPIETDFVGSFEDAEMKDILSKVDNTSNIQTRLTFTGCCIKRIGVDLETVPRRLWVHNNVKKRTKRRTVG
jgi:hypothetical protein